MARNVASSCLYPQQIAPGAEYLEDATRDTAKMAQGQQQGRG